MNQNEYYDWQDWIDRRPTQDTAQLTLAMRCLALRLGAAQVREVRIWLQAVERRQAGGPVSKSGEVRAVQIAMRTRAMLACAAMVVFVGSLVLWVILAG